MESRFDTTAICLPPPLNWSKTFHSIFEIPVRNPNKSRTKTFFQMWNSKTPKLEKWFRRNWPKCKEFPLNGVRSKRHYSSCKMLSSLWKLCVSKLFELILIKHFVHWKCPCHFHLHGFSFRANHLSIGRKLVFKRPKMKGIWMQSWNVAIVLKIRFVQNVAVSYNV